MATGLESLSFHFSRFQAQNNESGLAITDKAGIEFAVAFYDCLGAGKDVNFAFKLAKSQLLPLGEHKIPELL